MEVTRMLLFPMGCGHHCYCSRFSWRHFLTTISEFHPVRSAGGITTVDDSGKFHVVTFSCDPENTFWAQDAEFVTVLRAAEDILQEADARFQRGILVPKAYINTDCQRIIQTFKAMRICGRKVPPGWKQLIQISYLFEDAGIEFHINWCPKKAKIRPHTIADFELKIHQRMALQAARASVPPEKFRFLRIAPCIADRMIVHPKDYHATRSSG